MARSMMFFVMTALLLSMMFSIMGLAQNDSGVLSTFGLNNFENQSTFAQDDGSGYENPGGFYDLIFNPTSGLILVGLGAALVVGFLTKSSTENYVVLSIISGVFLLFIGTFWGLLQQASVFEEAYIRLPILIVGVMFSIGYIFTSVEFFRGNT